MNNSVVILPHSFASIHPEPAGVVHFLGGYFFGTGAGFWYKSLLDALKQKFTVHQYSYSFAQTSHWKIARDLLEAIEQLKVAGKRIGDQEGYHTEVYDDLSRHCLVGHSLGCECISLIRFLGLEKSQQLELLNNAQIQLGNTQVTTCDFQDVETMPQLPSVPYKASLLIAPCYKTPTGVSWLLKVRPQQHLVRYLIANANLLPYCSLISFRGDTIAQADATWMQAELAQQGNLVNFAQIDAHHPGWSALQYHMIPAFDPIRSGLAQQACEFISTLVNPPSADQNLEAAQVSKVS